MEVKLTQHDLFRLAKERLEGLFGKGVKVVLDDSDLPTECPVKPSNNPIEDDPRARRLFADIYSAFNINCPVTFGTKGFTSLKMLGDDCRETLKATLLHIQYSILLANLVSGKSGASDKPAFEIKKKCVVDVINRLRFGMSSLGGRRKFRTAEELHDFALWCPLIFNKYHERDKFAVEVWQAFRNEMAEIYPYLKDESAERLSPKSEKTNGDGSTEREVRS